MDATLEYLYYNTIWSRRDILWEIPDYCQTLELWQASLTGSELAQEDAAALREEIWGNITFAVGLRLGLSLSHALEPFQPEEP